jgi:hypothetical protein
MIREVWLYPPLGIARLGRSAMPCENFAWGPNDVRPRGTGKTTLVPAPTLDVAADGHVTERLPEQIVFKDAQGFRPVCPFFELHGAWQDGGTERTGPITPEVLAAFGLSLADVEWTVEVANLKPFHYTLAAGDGIEARLSLRGDQTQRVALHGGTPAGAPNPLVPSSTNVPLGSVQLTRSSDPLPGLRLRFTPAQGLVYGPTNLASRSGEYPLAAELLRLNPAAAWCAFEITDDARTNPGGLFAMDDAGVSLGLVDDVCDGWVRCTVRGVSPALARVVVGPPDYAPDRRPIVSLADGLKDRVDRTTVSAEVANGDVEETSRLVRDLLERAFETVSLTNVDYQNARARAENEAVAEEQGLPPEAAANRAFPSFPGGPPLALSERASRTHRRFLALEAFEDMLRERPDLLERVIREPMTGERYYDRRMPALMRGSDRLPLHLTRRQYDLLLRWRDRLRSDREGGT